MAQDFTIMLPNRPGVLANLSTKLGKAGINIEGISGTQYHDKVVVHMLFNQIKEAQALLYKNKITIMSIRDVLVAKIKDQPGELGKIAQKIANAEVNIDFFYLATNNRIVFGVDDPEKAAAVL
ncbi:MAG: hypothetical protein J7K66_04680 [Anaerolineaceae bacterium]|nr:hypothetical protein [Anaerolineaceae bacterium]